MGVAFAANLSLACRAWDISCQLSKVSNRFPLSKKRFAGYASTLESFTTIFLFLAFTVDDLKWHPGHALRQRHLDTCGQYVAMFDSLKRILSGIHRANILARECGAKPMEPVFQFQIHGIPKTFNPLTVESFGEFEFFLRQIETNIIATVVSAFVHIVDSKAWAYDWPPMLRKLFDKVPKICIPITPVQTTLPELPFPYISNYAISSVAQVEYPGFWVAVTPPPQPQNSNAPLLDPRPVKFCSIFFETSLNFDSRLVTPSISSANTTLPTPSECEAPILTVDNISSEGAGPYNGIFTTSLDYGRPRSRELSVSNGGFKIMRGAVTIDEVSLENEVLLVLSHSSEECENSHDVGAITVFWMKGKRGMDLQLRAVRIYFEDTSDLYNWTALFAQNSKLNMSFWSSDSPKIVQVEVQPHETQIDRKTILMKDKAIDPSKPHAEAQPLESLVKVRMEDDASSTVAQYGGLRPQYLLPLSLTIFHYASPQGGDISHQTIALVPALNENYDISLGNMQHAHNILADHDNKKLLAQRYSTLESTMDDDTGIDERKGSYSIPNKLVELGLQNESTQYSVDDTVSTDMLIQREDEAFQLWQSALDSPIEDCAVPRKADQDSDLSGRYVRDNYRNILRQKEAIKRILGGTIQAE